MLKQRVITALALVAALGLILFSAPNWLALTFFAGVVGVAGWEWGGLLRWSPGKRAGFGAILVVACMTSMKSRVLLEPAVFGIAAVFWLAVVPIWLRMRWSLLGANILGEVVGAVVLLPLWFAVAALLDRGPWWLLGVMAIVWVADISAYFAGRQFGRRKLAPTISPGKTWEGVIGAMLGVPLYVWAVATWFGPNLPTWILLAPVLMLLTLLSVAGDLFESMLKRQAELKDSSQLLPGHGGVLDRVDALTSTVPLATWLLQEFSR